MIFKEYGNSLRLLHFENISKYPAVVHFVSTRAGGHSSPPFDSLNLGLHVGDNPGAVRRNRQRLASILDIKIDDFVLCQQVHGNSVKVVSRVTAVSEGIKKPLFAGRGDAMVTEEPGLCLMILIADCVPVLFSDSTRGVVAIAHAGWRGTVRGAARRTVQVLLDHFGCSENNIKVGIGPSIGPCCYEVGPEVIEAVKSELERADDLIIAEAPGGKGLLDLWEANKRQLLEQGIPERNIETARLCTRCNSHLFFSYRYHGIKSGRIAAGIMTRKNQDGNL
jgi:YfiH family protein